MTRKTPLRIDILTAFPNILDSYLAESLFKRAIARKLVLIKTHNLRHYAKDARGKIDDRPFGGGPGMVIQIEPVYRALQKIKLKRKNAKVRIVLLSTRGQIFDNRKARALAGLDQVIFICGRYEGVDERVASHLADEEISLGAFVLSGGELAAMVIAEAACRFIPGFLGKEESLEEIKGSYPVYTRPPVFELPARKGKKAIRWPVPDILLTGDHKKIEAWRNQKPSGSSR